MIKASYAIVLAYGLALLCFTPVAIAATLFGARPSSGQSARLVSWGALLVIVCAIAVAMLGAGWTWDEFGVNP